MNTRHVGRGAGGWRVAARVLVAAVVVGLASACAAPRPPVTATRVERAAYGPHADGYRLSNGTVDAVVSPATGRIVRFGFVNGPNVFWENPAAASAKPGDWPNWGGDKLWVWPQDGWPARVGADWPPPGDPPAVPFTIDVRRDAGGDRIVMTSPPMPAFGVRLVREIALAPSGGPVLTVVNRFDVLDPAKASGIALWNVTQVPAPDEVTAGPVYERTAGGQVRRTYPRQMQPSSEPWPVPQPSLVAPDEVVFKRPRTAGSKVGLDADRLRVRVGETFVAQKATFAPTTGDMDDAERAQLYTSGPPSKNAPPGDPGPYLELEFVSPKWSAADAAKGTLTITTTLWRPAGGRQPRP